MSPRKLLWLGLAISIVTAAENSPPQPVLVELFTSEGCSSCPPADALLARMDHEQPIPGAAIIVLSEHVDYWNHLGWTDPYSAPFYTTRQENYARRFGLRDPYTPQMVVDGNVESSGNDPRKIESAIRAAIGEPRVGIRIRPSPAGDRANIQVDPFPAGKNHKAGVYLARAADHATSDVLGGENRGRTLRHVAIARDIRQVGGISQRAGLQKEIPISSDSRLIVFVQDTGDGRVWGAALYTSALSTR
ncbi:MAG TPA: DUF1223 domain-containing protein [Bryobacteraceae bacterium]|nr:DUF1223 domain-containing protein [Bryobacteraceae bacterium]